MSKYDHWYKKQRWRNMALRQLQKEPLCAMCLQRGIVTAASVADHIVPHKGNYKAFWFPENNLQSLCVEHHNRDKQRLEVLGFSIECGASGLPVDLSHPFNQIRKAGGIVEKRHA